jgi:hypothetical protein
MARMAVVQHDAQAARHALPDAGQPAHQQHRYVRLDGKLVKRVPNRIAGRIAQTILALAKAEKTRTSANEPLELGKPEVLQRRIGGQPVTIDDIAVATRKLCRIVIRCPDFIRIGHAPGAVEVQDGAHVAAAEAIGHLLLGLKGALSFEHALGVLVFLHRAVMKPCLRAEMRMAIEIAHVILPTRSSVPTIPHVRDALARQPTPRQERSAPSGIGVRPHVEEHCVATRLEA